MISNARARRTWSRPTTMLLVLACLAIQAFSASAVATAAPSKHAHAARGPLATSARMLPPALKRTARRSRRADRVLVARAKSVKRCLRANRRHPNRCKSARRALQRAGRKLTLIEQHLATVASRGGSSSSFSATRGARVAPTLTVTGQKLSWNRVANMNTYVLVVKVPGQSDRYSVVTGTSLTPPPVPGFSVRYSVRTTAEGSAWATEKTITYADAKTVEKPKAPEEVKPPKAPEEVKTPEKPKAPEEVSAPEKVNTQAAPQLVVSGQKLVWNPIAGVTTYVLVTKVPGQVEKYTEVTGTSTTPAAVPGVSVLYSVRTAVEGSAWAPEVTITFPASTPTPPPTAPPTETAPKTGSMLVSVDAGGWGSSFASDIAGAANTVRVSTSGSMAGWTAAGIKVISLVGGSSSSGVASLNASTVASQAVADVKTNPGLAALEVLNEPGQSGFWGANAGSAANAAAYDRVLKTVHEALVANFGSSYPPVLASYDGGEGPTTWGEEMWAADSNVGSYINGITMHSYGGTSSRSASALGSRYHIEAAHAQHPNIPIWVTEIGWPTAVGQPSTGDSLQWSEAEQAQNITNFVNWAKGSGYIADVTIFNYRDYGSNDYYGIETASGAHKLGYSALGAFK
jgi:Glycosyl hydrolase catalytic core